MKFYLQTDETLDKFNSYLKNLSKVPNQKISIKDNIFEKVRNVSFFEWSSLLIRYKTCFMHVFKRNDNDSIGCVRSFVIGWMEFKIN